MISYMVGKLAPNPPEGWSNMSPLGAIFVPFSFKTGTKLLHPLPPSIVERVSKGHRRDKTEKHKQKRTDSRNKLETTAYKRREGSPISGGIQPRHEDKGKGNGCNTQRNKKHRRREGDNNHREIKD